jgi:LPXTG-motif cell wall-anchored protein
MRWVWLIVGVLLVLLGGLWTLQGLNLLGQTGGMNGQGIWAVIGLIVVVVGLVLAGVGLRRR